MISNIKHWKELTGNKFITGLQPSMLDPDGCLKEQSIPTDRRKKLTGKGYVIYDRDYVVAKLAKQIELLEIDIDTAIDLIGDCFVLIESKRSNQEILDHETRYRGEVDEYV